MTKHDRLTVQDDKDLVTISRSTLGKAIVSELMAYFSDSRASGVVFLESEARYITGGIFRLVFSECSAVEGGKDTR